MQGPSTNGAIRHSPCCPHVWILPPPCAEDFVEFINRNPTKVRVELLTSSQHMEGANCGTEPLRCLGTRRRLRRIPEPPPRATQLRPLHPLNESPCSARHGKNALHKHRHMLSNSKHQAPQSFNAAPRSEAAPSSGERPGNGAALAAPSLTT
jgi:hypothetical protein